MIRRNFVLNGIKRIVVADPEATLLDVIRGQLGFTGTKIGCEKGQCGVCNVIMDGKLIKSCLTKMKRVGEGANVLTVEGIGTPDNLHPLQLAFTAHAAIQCGFCTPGFIVAAKQLLDENPKPTREDIRDWFQKNRNACRCTGYSPIVDAVIDAAKVLRGEMTNQDLAKKIPTDKLWGGNVPRPSAVAKACGTLDYGTDIICKMPPGSLYGCLVQAKVSHANIKGIDTSEAEKMPGVYKVVTHKDVKGKNRITGLITFPTNKGDGWDRPILCDEKVFQYGDAIAIVCADTEAHARAAAEKVKVDLEVLPAYLSAPAAMAPDAIEIHPGTPNVYYTQHTVKGEDTKPLMEKAAYVVEGEFYLQRQPHLVMETDVGYGFMDEEGRVTVCTKSIAVWLHVFMIAEGLGLTPDKFRVIQNPTGGTFGYKFCPSMEALLGAAVMATGKPVALRYDMAQTISYTGKRSPFWLKGKLAADKDGNFIAFETDWSVDHGPYSEFGDLLTVRGNQFLGAGYNIPNIRGEGRTVCTNHCWGAPYRAYGSPQAFLCSESLVDMLAEKMGKDPLELRFQNCYRPGATTPTGQTPEVFPFPEQFDMLRPLYKAAVEKAKKESTPEKKKGVGLSVGIYGCGLDGPDASEAWIELLPDGCVQISNSWEDHGQGADCGTLCHAHEALRPLGITPDKIKMVMNDTAFVPNSGPSGGSRQHFITGHAIVNGCQLLLEAMKKPNGTFRTYDEMVAENIPVKYEGKYTDAAICTPCDPDTGQGNPFSAYMYGVFMAEVTVDTKTGKATVDKYTHIGDVGKLGSKQTVDGQMLGGVAQGIGLALTEDHDDYEKHMTLMGCGFPYIKDIPDEIVIKYTEYPRETHPFGSAGVGELPLTSPHVAVINAIANATGVRITHLPALPEKVLAGLKALKK